MGHKNFNYMTKVSLNHFEIGMCPICGNRLTAEKCPPDHMTDEYIAWYAAQILAEQELYTDGLPAVLEPAADPRTAEEKALDEWQADCKQTEFGSREWFAGIEPIEF